MGQDSKIEWTHHTADLWHGCAKVHTGCKNCYAEKQAKRFGSDIWGVDKPRKQIKGVFADLQKMHERAKAANEIHRVFVGSMMDIFEDPMQVIDSKSTLIEKCDCYVCEGQFSTEHIRQWFFRSVVLNSPNLLFLLLTKRPQNIIKCIPHEWIDLPPANVMYGTSISDQSTANLMIPRLLMVPGMHFLSVEPQVGPISLRWAIWHDYNDPSKAEVFLVGKKQVRVRGQYDGVKGIDWIIQGGESGPLKRPFDLTWARSLRDECQEAGIPYFFKQIDKIQPIPEDLQMKQFIV